MKIDHSSFRGFIEDIGREFADRSAYSIFRDGAFVDISYRELQQAIYDFSWFLSEQNLNQGDRIAIYANSCPEWVIGAFGILLGGATLVPIDPGLDKASVARCLQHAEAKWVFYSAEFQEACHQFVEDIASLKQAFSLIHWRKGSLPVIRPHLGDQSSVRAPAEVALIAYTSGTGGHPKGVMLCEQALMAQARYLSRYFSPDDPEACLSILPLNHLYGFSCNIFGVLINGATLTFAHSLLPEDLSMLFQSKKPTILFGVPHFAQVIYDGIRKQLGDRGKLVQGLFGFLLIFSAIVPRLAWRRKIFAKVIAKFGGRLRNITVGGAPLSIKTATFFERIGVPVYCGYGLSETSPIIAASFPGFYKKGGVGIPMAEMEVKIAKEHRDSQCGEILVRGPGVMMGYLKLEDLNQSVFQDGWFHTGDIGYLDGDGFLFITGRAKNMVVLGSGKKVFPEELELLYSSSPMFEDVCVVGIVREGALANLGEQVIVVVVAKEDIRLEYQDRKDELERMIYAEIRQLNRHLASYKQPQVIIIKDSPFNKTTSMKVRRCDVIEELKSGERSS